MEKFLLAKLNRRNKNSADFSNKEDNFRHNSIPLIFIPITDIEHLPYDKYLTDYREKLTLLIANHLKPYSSRTKFPAYCPACREIMKYMKKNDNSGSFYKCQNSDCSKKTFSSEYIPGLLNECYFI